MPYSPLEQDEIYDALRERITGQTDKLTNFEEESLNYVLAYHGFAGYFSRYEHAVLAVQLSAWIEFAGGPIDEEDLIQLGIETSRVDLDLLNSFMDDSDLDALALRNGVTRDPGDYAEGEVLFLTTEEGVSVPAGVEVTTAQDRFGQQKVYETTEESREVSETTGVVAHVEAVEIGPEYNTGPGTIRNIPETPSGVRDVTNQEAITGGERPETNAELRTRAKSAITQQTGGGTRAGIQGGLVEMIDGVDSDNVFVNEHLNPDSRSPWVEITVDGGEDRLVQDAIESLRPVGIEHILNRPTEFLLEIDVTLEGSPVNLDRVESQIATYVSNIGLGEQVNRAQVISYIMNADDDISNITDLTLWTEQTGDIPQDLDLEPDEKVEIGAISIEV